MARPDARTRSRRPGEVGRSGSRQRISAGLACGVVTAAVTAPWLGAASALVGWDVAAGVFTAWSWHPIARLGANETERHATRDDPGRAATDLIVVGAALASLIAVAFVLARANGEHGAAQDLLAVFGLASLAASWFAVHTVFTLRYARQYYGGRPGGIDFHGSAPPRYVDFAYLAFTVGMTFQVSDPELTDSGIRATVLRQALLSYLFGAGIIAAAINLVVNLGSSGGSGH